MYENVTYELLLERMLGRVSDKFDKREGSVIWDSHSPTAIEFQILYLELDTIIRNSYGDTAAREFLIRRCKERGITPYPASHAVLKGVVSPAEIDVTGKKFSLDVLNYVVLERISGETYQVRCETPGIMGHQQLGKLIPIEYINGLTNAELTEVLIPGEDEEETEALRQRYFDSFKGEAFGGNVRDYLEKVHAIPGVGSVKVTRVWNCDIRPAEMIPTPRVSAWYREIIGKLEVREIRSWLDAVYIAASQNKLTTGGTVLLTILGADHNPASDVLVEAVQNTIDPPENTGEGYGLAPIGHVVTVKSADAAEVCLTTRILFEEGYGWDNLQPEIDDTISNYLLELRRQWEDASCLIVRLSQIEARLLSIKGVIDIQDTALNGSPENLVLDRYEEPVFGGAAAC